MGKRSMHCHNKCLIKSSNDLVMQSHLDMYKSSIAVMMHLLILHLITPSRQSVPSPKLALFITYALHHTCMCNLCSAFPSPMSLRLGNLFHCSFLSPMQSTQHGDNSISVKYTGWILWFDDKYILLEKEKCCELYAWCKSSVMEYIGDKKSELGWWNDGTGCPDGMPLEKEKCCEHYACIEEQDS